MCFYWFLLHGNHCSRTDSFSIKVASMFWFQGWSNSNLQQEISLAFWNTTRWTLALIISSANSFNVCISNWMEYPCLCRLLSSHTKAIHANVFVEKFKTVSNYGSDINFLCLISTFERKIQWKTFHKQRKS